MSRPDERHHSGPSHHAPGHARPPAGPSGSQPYASASYGPQGYQQRGYEQQGYQQGEYRQRGFPPVASPIQLHAAASRGLGASLGLDPFVAFAMCVVDGMLFGGADVVTGGAAIAVTVPVGFALAIPCILLQRYTFNDTWGAAIGKGLMVGVLTAIPFGIGTFPIAGMGLIGWRAKKQMQP